MAPALVRQCRKELPRSGVRKLHGLLTAHWPPWAGVPVPGRDELCRLLRAAGWLVPPKSAYVRTTHSTAPARYANHYAPLRHSQLPPERVWVSDLTFVRCGGGFYYLALVMDAASRRVMGWQLSTRPDSALVCQALKSALAKRRDAHGGLIHHSDRGTQYSSGRFAALLRGNGLTGSMGAQGNAYDNAQAERLINTLKHEFGLAKHFRPSDDVYRIVDAAIESYNHLRPHNAIHGTTPYQYHLLHLPSIPPSAA